MPTITGTSGSDNLQGTAGDDTILGLGGDDILSGNGGNDRIEAGGGNDAIVSGSGNDNIYTGTGTDTVNAGAGNDYIYSESTSGTLDGGDGHDFYAGNFSAVQTALAITIGNTINVSDGTVVSNVESFGIGGGSGNDLFTVNSAPNGGTVYGGEGYDTLAYNITPTTVLQLSIEAHGGNQLGGSIGPIGSQLTFHELEGIAISGSQLDDTFRVWGGYSGSGLSFNGGGGADLLTLDFAHSMGALSFIVAADGSISSSLGTFASFELFVLHGGRGADTLFGGAGGDTLSGGLGSDQLNAGAGNDVLIAGAQSQEDDGAADHLAGGSGNDTFYAGAGDSVDGGSGIDTLHFDARAATAGIIADFSQLANGGIITIGGGTLTGIEALGAINATNFADQIVAASSGSGAQILGWDGNDRIRGSSAGDAIYGGNGNDVLTGGLGHDTLIDGDGNDTFSDTAAGLNGDTIGGFGVGDKIIITDAQLSSFTFGLSGNVLSYSGGALTLVSELPGTLVASAAVGGGVQLEVKLPPLATNDQIASYLVSGHWNGDVHRWNVTQGGLIAVNISMLGPTEQAVARAALASWSDIIGIHFQEVTSGGQIVFENSEQPGDGAYAETAWANGFMTSAVIHVPSSWLTTFGSSPGSFGYETYVHEIGHALGLGHPGNYNGTATYAIDALFANDGLPLSIMSYFDMSANYYFAAQGFSNYGVATPMQADIIAMQTLYGLSTTTRAGDTVYGFNTNAGDLYNASGSIALTIFDSGGVDTLDYSNVFRTQVLNLNPETFSNVNGGTGNLSIARGVIIENAIGGYGADTIIGNGANNVLTGNGSADYFTGGAGNDVFRDAESNFWGDTITDFSVGDSIVITDAVLSQFSFSLVGNALHLQGGYLTLSAPISGALVATAAAGGGVQLTLQASVPVDASNDFNGDGRSDILWRNTDGVVTNWLGQAHGGFSANHFHAATGVPLDWTVAGTGDFNGDGRDDVLWRNTAGVVTDWLGQASGGFIGNHAIAATGVPLDWDIVGTGDFNGDGRDDVLWRHASGVVTDWLGQSNGGFVGNHVNAATGVPLDWRIVGTGDFNGDGRDDVLWRNENGVVTNWLGQANGAFSANHHHAATGVPLDWTVVGTGDFNGDGRDDILWRHDNGTVIDWLGQASGGFVSNQVNSAVGVSPDWQVVGVGDYNGDGREDVLWRNTAGVVTDWLGQANGGFVANHTNAATSVPLAWQVQLGWSAGEWNH